MLGQIVQGQIVLGLGIFALVIKTSVQNEMAGESDGAPDVTFDDFFISLRPLLEIESGNG